LAKGAAESLRVAQDRLTHWTSVGAQCSPTVIRLVKQAAAKVAA
jgi:small subunit ribosomal protein S16